MCVFPLSAEGSFKIA